MSETNSYALGVIAMQRRFCLRLGSSAESPVRAAIGNNEFAELILLKCGELLFILT